MGVFARGKQALSISDRSGLRFPYTEMVREWNGSLVHYSEYEAKQPQLTPRPVGSDPQALQNPRVQGDDTPQLILLGNDPFEVIISAGNTYVNVYSKDHQRSADSVVRLRGFPQVTGVGSGGPSTPNLQSFADIPNISAVTDIDSVTGFTIQLGKIDASGNITGATTTDSLTNPISYFYFQSTINATSSGVQGGGSGCSVGPVTLKAV
jgi:hypothetical protein